MYLLALILGNPANLNPAKFSGYVVLNTYFNTNIFVIVQLWSRKQFPSDYDRSFVSTEENEDDMKTGHVSVKSWKTEDLLRDFDKFVQAAFDITKILQK